MVQKMKSKLQAKNTSKSQACEYIKEKQDKYLLFKKEKKFNSTIKRKYHSRSLRNSIFIYQIIFLGLISLSYSLQKIELRRLNYENMIILTLNGNADRDIISGDADESLLPNRLIIDG